MPIYVFKSALDGSLVEQTYPMGQCPSTLTLDGVLFKRTYTTPCISLPAPQDTDSPKIQEEVDSLSHDLGMQTLIPLKHQSPRQQLQDLRSSSSKFRDDMQRSTELARQKSERKQKATQERLHSLNTPENYLKQQVAKSKREFDSRRITL